MRYVDISCAAIDCIHHGESDNCDVADTTYIDIAKNGMCLDYAPLTEQERKEIL